MTDEPSDASASSFADVLNSPERTQFRLSHLLTFTGLMAIFLTVSGQPNLPDGLFSPLLKHLVTGWTIVFAILNSLAITVVGNGLFWRKRGSRFPDQPGHWLLLSMAITALIGSVQTAAYQMLATFTNNKVPRPSQSPTPSAHSPWLPLILLAVISLAFIAFHIWLNIHFGRKQSERRWKWLFYLKAFAPFLWAIGQILLMFLLLRTIVYDRREGIRRDSVHRCAVALELIYDLIAIVMYVGTILLILSQL